MNPFELLEVRPDASAEEIRQAYHRLAKQWHPDRFTGPEKAEAEVRFRQLAEAFSMVKDRPRPNEPVPAPQPAAPASAPEVAAQPEAAPVAPTAMGPEDWFRQGREALAKGDPDRALGLAHYALRLDASKVEYHLLLADALRATGGSVRNEIRALEQAQMLDPKNVDIMIRLAQTFEEAGMMVRANGIRARAVSLQPDHPALKARAQAAAKTEVAPAPEQPSLVDSLKGLWARLTGRN